MTLEDFDELEVHSEVYFKNCVYTVVHKHELTVAVMNADDVEYGVHYSLLENIEFE